MNEALLHSVEIRNYNFHMRLHAVDDDEIEITELFPSIYNALIRLVDLIEHIIGSHHNKDNNLTVIICEMDESMGTFSHGRTIQINSELLKNLEVFEKTFFHELVHFLFNGAFLGNNSFMPHLAEAVAVYFENYYYPDYYNLSLELLYDRLTKDNYAAGYYMIDRLFKSEKTTLRLLLNKYITDAGAACRREAVLKELSMEECAFVNELLQRAVDILVIEPGENYLYGGYGLIYRHLQMDSPMMIQINAGEIINDTLPGRPRIYEKVPARIKDALVKDALYSIDEDCYEEIALIYGNAMITSTELYNRVYNTLFLYQ